MNGETKSKILLVLVIGLIALVCGTIASAFVQLNLPQESILEEIENTTNISINDSTNVSNYTPQTSYKKKTYKSSTYSNSKQNTSTSSSSTNNKQSSNSGSSSSNGGSSNSGSSHTQSESSTSSQGSGSSESTSAD